MPNIKNKIKQIKEIKLSKFPYKYLIAGVCVIILILILRGCIKNSKKETEIPIPTVVVAQVIKKTVPIYAEYVATIDTTTSAASVDIMARVEAYLMQQNYKEGQPVKKGQLLFTLDESTYLATLQSANASLDKAKADLEYAKKMPEVEQARANLEASKAQLAFAQLNVTRLKPLAEARAVPELDYENALTDEKVAKADVAVKKALYYQAALNQKVSIEKARAEVENAKASIKQAKINLGYCTITSPIDGVAGERLYSPGNLVGQGQGTKLTTVTSLNPLRVDFSLSENDYLKIVRRYFTRKKEVTKPPKIHLILSDGTKYPNTGKIIIAQPTIDPKTGAITIIGEFPNPDYLLRPGMFARIELIVDYANDALLVPQKAVMVLQSAKIVYVLDQNNEVELKTIEPGALIDDMIIVNKGLKEGDRVITEGQLKVHPGMKADPTYTPATKEDGAK